MNDDRIRRDDEVWPPPIRTLRPAQTGSPSRGDRRGLASIWFSAAGLVCWIATILVPVLILLILPKFNPILIVLAGYFIGIACELAGAGLGLWRWNTRHGRAGLLLALVSLAVITALTLIDHHQTGQWPWSLNDDCGCDDLG